MALTKESLRSKTTKTVFERGEAYYQKKYVNIYQTDQFWKGEAGIKARVQGASGENYKVTLLLKHDQIYQYTCTCPAYKTYTGMCKHCVATALAYLDGGMENDMPGVRTSPGFRTLLNKYTDREIADVLAAKEQGQVFLVPRLIKTRESLKVEWRVGRERLYIIKDLIAFTDALKERCLVEYGKNLSFYHREEAFAKSCLPYLAFIEELVENYKQTYKNARGGYLMSFPLLRELMLTPVLVDRFLAMSFSEPLEFQDEKGQNDNLTLMEGNPEVEVLVEKAGRDGCRVSVASDISGFCGKQYFYIRRKHRLWKCDREHSDELGLFYQEILRFSHDGKPEMQISKRDLPAFCRQILPKLKHHVEVVIEDVDLTEYEPEPLQAKFYFDVDNQNDVILEPVFCYGEKTFSALKESRGVDDSFRDRGRELVISQLIKEYFTNRTEDGKLVIKEDDNKVFQLVHQGLPAFLDLGEVYTTEPFKNIRILPPPKSSIGVGLKDGWLDLNIDTGGLDIEQMRELLESFNRKKTYYRLKNGEFINLTEGSIATLAELSEGLSLTAKDLLDGNFQVPSYRALYLNQVLKEDKGIAFNRDGAFKELVRGLKSIEDSDYAVPDALLPILRGYQKSGFRWLKTLSRYGFGGILADDMGLGKTIQVITLLLSEKLERKSENNGISLIVCPASLIYNWENEINQFGFQLKSVVITGNTTERKALIDEAFSAAEKPDILITSYDLLKRDSEVYQDKSFSYQIIDEAQYIKNPGTKSAQAVKAIEAKRRFALTGTPIENRLSELWSIFDYLMPGFLYSYRKFKDAFEQPIVKEENHEALVRLHRMIDPFILRRLKKDVLKELPEKLETVVMSKFSDDQKELYQANAFLLKEMLENGPYQTEKLKVLAELTKLRQICCDPRLYYDNYHGESAKLQTCMELILSGKDGGHKMLLFSQFTSMLAIIEAQLQANQISYYKIIGATKKEERLKLVEAFNKDDTSVFLISLKAGGTGLNLTSADMVIHYDPWWNIAAQNQATDRAHRIGQSKVVSVFKLIAKDTIEENILKLQESKKDLADQVISEGTVSLSSLSKDDLMEILGGK